MSNNVEVPPSSANNPPIVGIKPQWAVEADNKLLKELLDDVRKGETRSIRTIWGTAAILVGFVGFGTWYNATTAHDTFSMAKDVAASVRERGNEEIAKIDDELKRLTGETFPLGSSIDPVATSRLPANTITGTTVVSPVNIGIAQAYQAEISLKFNISVFGKGTATVLGISYKFDKDFIKTMRSFEKIWNEDLYSEFWELDTIEKYQYFETPNEVISEAPLFGHLNYKIVGDDCNKLYKFLVKVSEQKSIGKVTLKSIIKQIGRPPVPQTFEVRTLAPSNALSCAQLSQSVKIGASESYNNSSTTDLSK